ncbi:hypothetical protein [Flavobacterium sp.]|uniref:FEKKY domain-containing protein n=1 Tax=Flavobacterium sp. TaxID=239 RepID=UPI002B53E3AF|nr:hypothetical protein [Flavobacterium sp.]HSD06243.1 hypothetical protein [Flavobacterium sp.]
MKHILKTLIIALLFVIASCNQKEKDDTNKVLTMYVGGLPDWKAFERSKVIDKKWGIECELLGCSGSSVAEKLNKKTYEILEKRYGKFWSEIHSQEVIEETLNWMLVHDLLEKDKTVIDLQKKRGEEFDDLRLYIEPLRQFEYVVYSVGYEDINKESVGVSYFRCKVNIKTKKVTLISDQLIKHNAYSNFY